MLDERIIEVLIERLVSRIEDGNSYVLEQIGKSIKKIGALSPTSAQQLQQVLKYGGNYDKIVQKLAEVTNLNVKEIYEIFEEVAKSDYAFARQFYEYRNREYIPYEKNYALQRQVKALANITVQEYLNYAQTRAIGFTVKDLDGNITFKGLQNVYNDAIDKAVLAVAQGKSTFDEQLFGTLKQIGTSGLKTLDFESGRSIRLDSAIRMNMKGALRNLHNETQKLIGQEYGSDGVEISVHLNPAPDHEEVQGRQFSTNQYDENGNLIKKGEFEKFQDDEKAVSYDGIVFEPEFDGHDRRSISEHNCYHYTFAIVLGVSKPSYTEEELEKIIQSNEAGFELDGKHYTNYEGTQLQRQLERAIRQQKDIQILAKASGNQQLLDKANEKINQLSYKYQELSDVSGLPTKVQRLRVSGYRKK